jgi:hypothetical protein
MDGTIGVWAVSVPRYGSFPIFFGSYFPTAVFFGFPVLVVGCMAVIWWKSTTPRIDNSYCSWVQIAEERVDVGEMHRSQKTSTI